MQSLQCGSFEKSSHRNCSNASVGFKINNKSLGLAKGLAGRVPTLHLGIS